VCSDAEGNAVAMNSTDGATGNNMTESDNSTSTSPCPQDKIPEITQECGASSTEEGDAEPVEDAASEVRTLKYDIYGMNTILYNVIKRLTYQFPLRSLD
jgi:hypothetical protein